MAKAKELAYGLLTGVGRATITGMLIAMGKQFVDWTCAYSLFWGVRMKTEELFAVASKVCLEQLTPTQMVVVHMDDTILRKSGKKIYGTGWKRDPLGPAFQTNLIWAQRFIQISMSIHDISFHSQSRSIPIDFHHCPSVQKPSIRASEEEVAFFKEKKKIQNLSKQGLERITELSNRIREQDEYKRQIHLSVDGSYTNRTILKGLPQTVTLIGRVRKDARLNYVPDNEKTKGRNIVYGLDAPTPEEVRKSDDIPWQEVNAWAAGKIHKFNVKIVKSLKWRTAGKDHLLQLVVIRPLGYTNKNGGKILYRRPAYLICTDNNLQIEKLLQAYLWRWEIEVNFRDEKTTTGCGDAQVRNEVACAKVPQFVVAIHAFLQLASHINDKLELNTTLPKAKWEKRNENKRHSTNNILNIFRGQVWFEQQCKSFSDFVQKQWYSANLQIAHNNTMDAMFYVRK